MFSLENFHPQFLSETSNLNLRLKVYIISIWDEQDILSHILEETVKIVILKNN